MTIADVEFYVGKGGIAPTRKTGDAGFDFYVPEDHPTVLLAPGKDILINTHIRSKLAENIALVAFNKSGIYLWKTILKTKSKKKNKKFSNFIIELLH